VNSNLNLIFYNFFVDLAGLGEDFFFVFFFGALAFGGSAFAGSTFGCSTFAGSGSVSMTWMAPSGHCDSHVLHTMQSSTLTGTDLPSLIS
jgi:hypothetical protein